MKKNAFTISEVLVTIGIMGKVATNSSFEVLCYHYFCEGKCFLMGFVNFGTPS